jgi:hypothetical protein
METSAFLELTYRAANADPEHRRRGPDERVTQEHEQAGLVIW